MATSDSRHSASPGRRLLDPVSEWRYGRALAGIGFLLGGMLSSIWAWYTAFPPSPTPEGAGCGTGLLAIPFLLLFAPPLGAMVTSAGLGAVGAVCDYLINQRRQSRFYSHSHESWT